GNSFFRGALYSLLSNPIYIGQIRHKRVQHPGLHQPTVDRELWDASQLLLRRRALQRAPRTMKSAASPLTGKLFDEHRAVKPEQRKRCQHSLFGLRTSNLSQLNIGAGAFRTNCGEKAACRSDLDSGAKIAPEFRGWSPRS